MGLFGGSKDSGISFSAIPAYPTLPNYPNLKTQQNSFSDMLPDTSRRLGTSFYEQFQPTSLESALANQYFRNIMPDIESSIKQNLSLSGMAYSPVLADLISKRRGEVGYDVGSFLANLGNQRANTALNTALGLSSNEASIFNQQNIGDWERQKEQLLGEWNRDVYNQQKSAEADAMARAAKGDKGGWGSMLGAGLGALFAAPAGGLSMLQGAGIGGNLASAFGGGPAPIGLGTSFQLSDLLQSGLSGFGGGSSNSRNSMPIPIPVHSFGHYNN